MRLKKKAVWVGVLIVLIGAAAVFYAAGIKNKAVEVDLVKVERGTIKEYVEESAVVRPEDEADVLAPHGGKIKDVYFQVGDRISKGAVLIKFDEEEIRTQIENLELQKKVVAANLAEAKSDISEAGLRKLEAQKKSAKAALEEAIRIVDNNRTLYDAGALSMDAYESALAALEIADANYEMAESSIELAKEGISTHREELYDIQMAEIQNQINFLQKKRRELSVVSPIEGIALEKDVSTGSTVQGGSRICQIGNIENMFLESDILADEIVGIKEGSGVLIENKDFGIKDVLGVVRKIYPKAYDKVSELGITQKRVKIEIAFQNDAPNLKPGYEMTVKIISDSSDNALLVNDKAIFEYQGKDYVFINDDGMARMTEITKGIQDDEKTEILKGLREGDEVVLSPDDRIKDGTKIRQKD